MTAIKVIGFTEYERVNESSWRCASSYKIA